MSKQTSRPAVLGQDYHVLDNGAVVVQRYFPNLLEEYRPEPIPDYLGLIDHKTLRIDSKKKYKKALRRESMMCRALVHLLKDARLSVIGVIQGWNGAGKSGDIDTVREAIWKDDKIFDRIPIGPPTGEELSGDFLERMHRDRRMPWWGQVHFFDRSWSERVLVEKVENPNHTTEEELRNAYAQIRSFEQLRGSLGHIVVKVFLHITSGEQKKRFQKRLSEKRDKLTDADKRERKLRPQYTRATNEMLHRTGTQYAPWHVISSENKPYSRVAFLQIFNRAMLTALHQRLGSEALVAGLAGRLAHDLKEKRLCKLLIKYLSSILDRQAMRKLSPKVLERLDNNKELSKKLDHKKLRRALDELLDEKND